MPQNNYGKQLTCLESRECQQHIVSNSETTVPLEVVNWWLVPYFQSIFYVCVTVLIQVCIVHCSNHNKLIKTHGGQLVSLSTHLHEWKMHSYIAETAACNRIHRAGSRYSLHFMKPQGSSPCSQELVLATILGQMNPVHTLPFYSFQMNINIILPLYFTLADIKLSLLFVPIKDKWLYCQF